MQQAPKFYLFSFLLSLWIIHSPLYSSTHNVETQTDWSLANELQKLRSGGDLDKNTLAQQLTLAELKEIISKVHDDLQNRMHYLTDNDKYAILEILKHKKTALQEEIKSLEVTLPAYLQETSFEDISQKGLTIAGALFAGITIIAIFILSSHEQDAGFHVPNWNRLKRNMG